MTGSRARPVATHRRGSRRTARRWSRRRRGAASLSWARWRRYTDSRFLTEHQEYSFDAMQQPAEAVWDCTVACAGGRCFGDSRSEEVLVAQALQRRILVYAVGLATVGMGAAGEACQCQARNRCWSDSQAAVQA